MFGSQGSGLPLTEWSADALEQALTDAQAAVDRARRLQARLVAEVDRRQTASWDGCRTLTEWVASRLDESPETARQLVAAARNGSAEVAEIFESGEVGFARAVELGRLAAAGVDDPVEVGWSHDIAGLRRRVAAQQRITPRDEAAVLEDRHLVMQPTLDEASWRLWGQLPGYDGRLVHKALSEKADSFPTAPGYGTAQRRADALTAIALRSLDGSGTSTTGGGSQVTVFVDAAEAAPTNAQTGVTLDTGTRLGPRVLDNILCDAVTEIRIRTPNGFASGGRRSRAVPPTVRRDIVFRDHGRCVIDACTTHDRTEIHHVTPRSEGGDHSHDNLVTLCWWHHHIGVHMLGLVIDPESPPHRRRLIHPAQTTAPT